jgi:hypothetical protein
MEQRAGQFLQAQRIGAGGHHQFAELALFARFQLTRFVGERLQVRIIVSGFSHAPALPCVGRTDQISSQPIRANSLKLREISRSRER